MRNNAADLANWFFFDCFDAESSELVLHGRGRISVTAEAVADILGLPNKGGEVKYELDLEAVNFILCTKLSMAQHPKLKQLWKGCEGK